MEDDTITVGSPRTLSNSSPPSSDPSQQEEQIHEAAEDQVSTQQDRPTTRSKAKLSTAYAPPGANSEELVDDLEDFGFDQAKVKDLMSKREARFDATMQRPHFQTREERENERRRLLSPRARGGGRGGRLNGNPVTKRNSESAGVTTRDGQKPVKKRKISGEGLVIDGSSSNWILFDPNSHDVPIVNGREPPAIFQKYMRFEPGNARIVEINQVSSCVRLKSTPESLEGKTINYTNEGPKITGIKPAAELKVEAPSSHPQPKRGGRGSAPGRARGRGGRGGRGSTHNGTRGNRSPSTTAEQSSESVAGRRRADSSIAGSAAERINGTPKTKMPITVGPTRLSLKRIKVEQQERDSGSESSLSDIEESAEAEPEIGDSQGEEGGLT